MGVPLSRFVLFCVAKLSTIDKTCLFDLTIALQTNAIVLFLGEKRLFVVRIVLCIVAKDGSDFGTVQNIIAKCCSDFGLLLRSVAECCSDFGLLLRSVAECYSDFGLLLRIVTK